MSIEQKIVTALSQQLGTIQNMTPKDTGNLAYNATKFESLGQGRYRIYVDEKIAPYFVFVENPWISSKWKGKQNPNEGYFEKAAISVANNIAIAIGGKIEIERN